jgi:hypothetical protein
MTEKVSHNDPSDRRTLSTTHPLELFSYSKDITEGISIDKSTLNHHDGLQAHDQGPHLRRKDRMDRRDDVPELQGSRYVNKMETNSKLEKELNL